MKRYIEWVSRNPVLVIVLTLLVTALALFQARSIKIVIDTNKMMPQSNTFVAASNDIEKVFGSKHVVVVGVSPTTGDIWQPDVLAKVQRMTEAFSKVPGVVKENTLSLAARRAKRIAGQDDGLQVQPLMSEVPQTPAAMIKLREAIAANPVYQNTIVSNDGRMASIIVEFADEPAGFRTIMDKVQPIIDEQRDASVNISVGGLPNFLSKVETYSERMAFLLPMSFAILCLVLYAAFRTKQGMFLPLVTALLAVAWGVGVMGASGIPMDVFNATTPILILAVATGHAVQLLKRYYEEYEALRAAKVLSPKEANREAVVRSLMKVGPVMMAAGGVAALGFFSLMVFEISTVRTFGIFTGLGILSAMVLELTFIPALRCVLPAPSPRGTAQRRGWWGALIQRIGGVVATSAGRRTVYVGATVVVVLALVGGSRIVEDNSVKRYFAASESFQQDDRTLNAGLGGTNTVFLLIEGQQADAIKSPAVLKAMDNMQQFLAQQPGVGKTMSLADFVRRMNRAMHADQAEFDRIPDDQDLISQYLLLYSMSGEPGDFDSYVDYDYRKAKLTAFVKTDSTAYAEDLIQKIRVHAASTFPAEVSVRIGGSAPQDTALNEAMVQDKLLNIAQIAAVVFVISSLIFRSVLAGSLVLLPLLLTVIVNFGIMGWSGILLNIPTSLTSAMAVGIGADYAIYLLFRLREELSKEPDPVLATRRVLSSAGEAILFVATAVAAGYGVLLFSVGFYIHMWLAILIASAMLVSALAALLLIPSIVLSLKPRFMFGGPNQRTSAIPAGAVAGLFAVVMLALVQTQDARAAEPQLVPLMERNARVTKVVNSTADATFTLINKAGQERVRRVQGFTRLDANGSDTQRVTRFLSPADVKGTVSLLLEHADKDDDIWIYLPALKKVRRLVSNNKKDSFVGTDFSYADVIGHKVSEWKYALLSEEVVDGQPCWVVEALPQNPQVQSNTGYSRRVNWIRKDNAMTVKSEFWDEGGQKFKLAEFKDIKQVDAQRDRWQAMVLESSNLQSGHKTIIKFERFLVNQDIKSDVFTVAAMERE